MADGNMAELKELGTLIVVVGKARNLPNKSRFGKQDPFCTVAVNDEKQKTKAIKRGGQHPEWDEELRFTIHEDVDDLLVRSESQNQFDSLPSSLSSKHASLSSHTNPSHPTPPPKDTANASLNSSLSGSVTAQSLANKSRKGPINKKGGKSMKVACYADDAKEPELIGECTVPIDDVLKLGEVDEWYEFSFKDKYSGEIYLELTFYSNDAPPIKRNVPRPSVHPYDLAASSSSSTLSARPGGLVSSGSVSGMNLYIPPYVQAGRVSPGLRPTSSGSFADLGLPPGHRQGINASASVNTMDALTRPMSGLSIANGPPAQQAAPHQAHGYGHHRHSLGGGGADAPWAQSLPQNQPSQHAGGLRPMSAAESMSHIPIDRRRTPQPQAFPGAQEHRSSVPLPIPSSLIPGQGGPRHGEPRPHAQSFSGPTRPVVPPPQAGYLQPSPGPTPPPHPNSAPPNNQPPQQPHYQMPTSSFAGLAQPPYDPRSASPYPGDAYGAQNVAPQPPSRSNSVPVRQPSPQPPGSYQEYTDRSHTPRPTSPGPSQALPAPQQTPPYSHAGHSSHSSYSGPPGVPPVQTPPHDLRVQSTYSQQPAYGYQPSPPPAAPAREPTPNSQGYIPWYQQTQPTPAPPPPPPPSQPSYGQQPYQAAAPPPPVPSTRPQSVAPPAPPPSRPSVGYYPSDELYVQQDQRTPAEPPRSRTPRPAPWQQAPPQPQRPVSPQPPTAAPWQQQAPYNGGYQQQQQAPVQSYEIRHTPSLAQTPAQYAPQSAGGSYATQQPGQAYQDQSYASSSTSPAPYAPQSTPSPYQHVNVGSSPPRAQPPPGWQSSLPAPAPTQQHQTQLPRAPSPMQSNGWNAPPPQPARAPSPLPTQIGQDWRSYMQSLSTPSNPGAQPGRTPSPAPPPAQPAQANYYTPPPSFPSSLKPPDGWQSSTPTSSDGHQWKR